MKQILMICFMVLGCIVVSAQQKVHVVKSGESLYSISKKYNITIDQLKKANKLSSSQNSVQIGQKLVIPGTGGSASTSSPASKGTVPAKVHVVQRGESLYAICKKYGVQLSDVKSWNKLSDLNIKPGQRLIVSKANTQAMYKPKPVPSTPDTEYAEEDTKRARSMPPPTSSSGENPSVGSIAEPNPEVKLQTVTATGIAPQDYPTVFEKYGVSGYQISKNRGEAAYLSESTSGNQNLAFYSNAETGSIIRVTNLLNQKTIYVKVIGKVPPIDAGRDIMLKLSNKAAQELGASEEKFLVEVASYARL